MPLSCNCIRGRWCNYKPAQRLQINMIVPNQIVIPLRLQKMSTPGFLYAESVSGL
jgi:hypothetical protein